MARFFVTVFRYLIVVSILGSGIHYLINNKTYIFSPREIRRVGGKFVGQHPNQCLMKVTAELRKKYFSHIVPDNELRWITLSVGGLKTRMVLLHGSLTEFLTVLGTPLRSSGNSGIHWVNESCSILTGSVQRIKDTPNLSQKEDYGPGDHFKQYMGEVYLVDSAEESWFLCYGRGFVPTSAPYMLADSLLSSVEPVGPAKLVFVYGQSVMREFALWVQESFHYYTRKWGLIKG